MRIKRIGWSLFALWVFLPALVRAEDEVPAACPSSEGFNETYTRSGVDPFGVYRTENFLFKIGTFNPTDLDATRGSYSFGDITSQSQKSVLKNAFIKVHCYKTWDVQLGQWVIYIWDDGAGGLFEWLNKFDEEPTGEETSFGGPSSGDGGTAANGGQHGNWLLYEYCLYTVWYVNGVEAYRELEYCWIG